MHLETFAHGHSVFHRMDPRAKLPAAAAFSIVVGISTTNSALWAAMSISIVVLLAARLPLYPLIKRLWAVNVFIVFLWLVLPWRLELAQGWNWSLVWDPRGLALAGKITLKANAIVMILIGLLSTSPINNLFHALAHLRVPVKLVHMFLFFYRYLHVLHREYHKLALAIKARGFQPANNLHTYQTYAHLAGMVLVKSYDRAEKVYQAMLCRGFSGTYWLLDHFHWSRRESWFLIFWGAALAGLSALSWGASPWS
jgi:cobalt/nickel transport system permease protein